MVSPDIDDVKKQLFAAIKDKQKSKVQDLLKNHPELDINSKDGNDFTFLQNACHSGDVEIVKLLLDEGADINYSGRQDKYTPLMLAAIGNKHAVVNELLRRGVDKMAMNCVNRTAGDMAAFVGLTDISKIINCWIPYENTIGVFTKSVDLEKEPRLCSEDLGVTLHRWLVLPSIHPVRLLLYLKDNIEIMINASQCIYVLDRLSSKFIKPPTVDETLSFKFHIYSRLLEVCNQSYLESSDDKALTSDKFSIFLFNYLRRLTHRVQSTTETKPKMNELLYKCILSYPYNSSTYQSIQFALSQLKSRKIDTAEIDALAILIQSMEYYGPRQFGNTEGSCEVCQEGDNNKKCSLCKTVYYCSPDCQKVDWTRHRKVCKNNK